MMFHLARAALAAASVACVATGASAEQPLHAGSFSLQITKQEAQPLGSKEHVLVSAVSHGTNKSIGSEPIEDGGQALVSQTMELNNGNGPDRGLYSVADAKGSTTAAFEGTITTTMVDGKPRTSAHGTWRHVSSSGAYKGANGAGTYSWTMTSPQTSVGEWKENVTAAAR